MTEWGKNEKKSNIVCAHLSDSKKKRRKKIENRKKTSRYGMNYLVNFVQKRYKQWKQIQRK